ncbi:MAG: UDP-N-acetylmuramate dehydrogenase [Firmicutes bacterium]|uniref:UDP-N-acetylenolpyruvoylglucosamine reductase n=1 Tax=Melghirimyces thermohalophilus TaxID=1236220 RepID=A0A1G6HS93_9BACL|nr:UDP-N-acetylmuramate dehydrogenase [Melghirimyces thermohalophilus]MDA8354419.1 UDP-N-acetylmuramate dehydrogenase [Bacillota bacterium]SDB96745.1 UDP-N-acetylmuramate dehydrogenase [Melghirimyces thermohalophilus]
MEQIAQEIKESQVRDVRSNEPLSRHTTWRVGGPADILIYPRTKGELERTMAVIRKHGIPWRVIGKGSNLLVRDGGIRGAVIKMGNGLDEWRIDKDRVTAGGGLSFVKLSVLVSRQGLTGLEFAGGIPGTVGGAVFMNAGAHGSELSHVLESAEVLLETGQWAVFSNQELQFSYRTSILQREKRGVVTEATFRLQEGDREQVLSAMAKLKDYRRQTQPLQYPCAGSVFRNPSGDHSGRLIEAAGLKGYRVGDAEVSTQHANFIINRGNATANDVLTLIEHIIGTIEDKYGVTLVPEVQVVGEG